MGRKAFIVRPFGNKSGINFENVQQQLIAPALAACDIEGGTTEPFLEAGNIRADMFQQLLVADIVIADISIHNANVFYELGVRHALQPQKTFMIRAKSKKDPKDRSAEDDVPFDLKTDRYLQYDSDAPVATVDTLIQALRQTIASEKADSPVFQMLPDLQAQERSRFLPVPQGFRDEVDLASKAKQLGMLGVLASEARDFFWASEGLRLVARAQFDLKAHRQAKDTWEELYRLNPAEVEANQRLGTCYERMGNLDASDQALKRVLANGRATSADRAEALSLMARNVKDRWRESWKGLTGEVATTKALQSAHLLEAYGLYRQGFMEDLNSFYPGLNALSLLVIAVELAKLQPTVWEGRFDTDEDASRELGSLVMQRQALAGAVGSSLEAAKARMQQRQQSDRWLDISLADYQFLTVARPSKVAFAYSSALNGAPDFYFDAARKQLELFQSLGILKDNTQQALEVFKPAAAEIPAPTPPRRTVFFTGHMIDEPGRNPPRFPNSLTASVRAAIKSKLQQEQGRTDGAIVTVASGACGGDLLFHEVCEELVAEHRLYLPLTPDRFRNESVSPAGRDWEDRFDTLLKQCKTYNCMAASPDLPTWLSAKKGYTTWQRANLWLVHEALALGADSITLLALWDGVKTEGLGGTSHTRMLAQQYGAAIVTIYTNELLNAAGTLAP
ncbi:MAG TPA: tetratricopeptide repeat-containing protein [Terriglobales bacterium]